MKIMNQIDLIPLIQATDLQYEVCDEMDINEVSTHYKGDVLCFDWDEENDGFSATKKWLVEFYGEEIKKYGQFAIMPT